MKHMILYIYIYFFFNLYFNLYFFYILWFILFENQPIFSDMQTYNNQQTSANLPNLILTGSITTIQDDMSKFSLTLTWDLT